MVPTVGSSWVSGIDYDPETKIFTYETHGKRTNDSLPHRETYHRAGIPPIVWEGAKSVLMNEGSIGNYINRNVKGFGTPISQSDIDAMNAIRNISAVQTAADAEYLASAARR